MKLLRAFCAVLVFGAAVVTPPTAFAAFGNSSISTSADMLKHEVCWHIQGQLTGNATAIVQWKPTENIVITKIRSRCRAKTGTITVDWQKDGTSILDPVTTITSAGTVYDSVFAASATTVSVTAGQVLDFDLAVGTDLDDFTTCITYRTLGTGE